MSALGESVDRTRGAVTSTCSPSTSKAACTAAAGAESRLRLGESPAVSSRRMSSRCPRRSLPSASAKAKSLIETGVPGLACVPSK
eukprot:scaffold3506_cov210-Pinguiococcus_pyrenoidosus.AAC.2